MLTDQIENIVSKAARKTKTLQFAVDIPSLGIEYAYSSTEQNQKFHSASVGKLMTATLIFIAAEQNILTLETRVADVLEKDKLDGLFIVDGKDYQDTVTIRQLLGHTSGINDYFEGKTFDNSDFVDEMIQNPNTFWKPDDLLNYTRNRQQAIAAPGQKFFYSDTGYVLLGLIIEKVFALPFHSALDTFVFRPAGMVDTTMCFYSDGFDQNHLAPLYIQGIDVHLFESLSCDFSGGGLSTTTSDLLKFLTYLHSGGFISAQSVTQMAAFGHKYRQGLHYGLGMMQIRFEEFFFLLKQLPRLQGHLGVTGVHAWYDPVTGTACVLNVGDTGDMVMSFKLLIRIMQLIVRTNVKSRKG